MKVLNGGGLKPCPFCGGRAGMYAKVDGSLTKLSLMVRCEVVCRRCTAKIECCGPSATVEGMAKSAWNLLTGLETAAKKSLGERNDNDCI